jgi:glycosyltransferase involved in cell wall biosynthesis
MEQYKLGGVGEFSPETDIYALGATFFNLLTGVTPPSAFDVNEHGVPVDELKAKGVSKKAINIISKAMEPLKRVRMKNVRNFIDGLQGTSTTNNQNDEDITIITPEVQCKEDDRKRKEAREALGRVAGQLLGGVVPENALFVCISGRQEWKNKGIDVFASALDKLAQKMYHSGQQDREVVAFVMIPYLDRAPIREGKVSVVFVPYYLDGNDPLFGKTYYDLLIGMDVTVFPSYYEPWGYTPLESCAFHVPTITTSLAGFGEWAARQKERYGVIVIERNDSNFNEVAEQVAEDLLRFARLNPQQLQLARKEAAAVAKKADWKHFFQYYRKAYDIALKNRTKRLKTIHQKQ